MELKTWIKASKALIPASGAPAACEARPKNSISTGALAKSRKVGANLWAGWAQRAASTFWKKPALT